MMLSPVLGDIADLERRRGRKWKRWRDENGGHAPQSSASPAPDLDATRSFDPNNEDLPAALT
jgi:hypothetical protein